MTGRELPVGRGRLLLWGLGALLGLVLAGAGLELLRHPDELGDAFAIEADPGDPRVAVECPEPTPREGLPRGEEVGTEVQAPTAVTSGDLLTCPESHDGRRVVLRGEAVGQALGRGERAWLQVNDDIYAGEVGPLPGHRYFRGANGGIGVSLPRDQLEQLSRRGGPGTAGDRVEVRGVFHRVDPASGEMAVVAGERLEVVGAGGPLARQPLRDRQVVAYVLSVLALGMVLVQRRRARA